MFFKRKENLEERVERAKKDSDELNKLIKEYRPFIISTVQKKVGRYVKSSQDDEISIGMIAFKEAIDSFDSNKGKFLSFAKQVINLRLIDYYRKEKNKEREVYLDTSEEDNDNKIYEIGTNKAIEIHRLKEENEIRKFEIIEYGKELKKWGIDFNDLVKVSPKSKRLRELYKEISKIIVGNKELLDDLIRTKRLPIKKIQKFKKVHRKKIERGRIYIIALVLIFIGEYEYIKSYIDGR
ncbi:RNA polymerase sigma-I factor [Thermohalobacter berrensis]|uniref:RNA polymerase sigma factor SigI n=1 Tax=Thermohalobacter berrensis TaxID=99594 RepID=A0A419TB06_9FIRM|nr:RNA polymerase sigma-I factor [Thermohalobacter berrensis]RKD34674.1 RNA polymerase sigma-I factor [Thermohalobacter berrensis]